jgi:hypothetical protein
MAALSVALCKYSTYLTGAIEGNNKFKAAMFSDFGIPNSHASGPIYVTLWDAVTARLVVDGTMLQNGMSNTAVALTYVNQCVPLSLPPSSELTLSSVDIARGLRKGAGKLIKQINSFCISDMIGSSTTHYGQLDNTNFSDHADGDDLAVVNEGISYIESVTDADRANMFIALYPSAYAGLRTLVDALVGNSFTLRDDTVMTYQGIPLYSVPIDTTDLAASPISGATNWGASSPGGIAGYVGYREAVACASSPTGAYLHGGGPSYADDGTIKFIWQSPFAHGLLDADLLYEIRNT